jgi:Arc/MetJ-type ribon-helix-helix transcriptional regulator
MKCQASITVDEKLLLQIKDKINEGYFRNQSHFFEFAARQLLNLNKRETDLNLNLNLKSTLMEDRK